MRILCISKGAPNTVTDISTSFECFQVSPTHEEVENRNDIDLPLISQGSIAHTKLYYFSLENARLIRTHSIIQQFSIALFVYDARLKHNRWVHVMLIPHRMHVRTFINVGYHMYQ